MGGGWYHRPRRRYYGGGCFSGVFSIILLVIFLILFVVGNLFSYVGSGFNTVVRKDTVWYDEEKFQDYADQQYAAEFGRSSAYEDNLLIVFLVDENHSDFYYIAWVGDHIDTDINYMLGGNDTELGQAMNACINITSYKYSLDSNLAQVMNEMTEEIKALGLDGSFSCQEDHVQVDSHLTNHSELSLTAATVNDALAAFTDATGIPAVIVVEDVTDVFGQTASASGISSAVMVTVVVIVIVLLVRNLIRRRRENDDDFDTDRRYRDFDN